MNLTEAKAAAGIAPHIKVAGAKGAKYGQAQVHKRIVEARRSPLGEDHPDLPTLGEAKAFFRQMLNRFCPICGVPIAQGAKACALHGRQKAKALPLPAAYWATAASSRPPAKERKLPYEAYAICGYWAPAVQKVVRRWRDRMGQDGKDPEGWCKHYVAQASLSIKGGCRLDIQPIHQEHMGYVLELLTALHEVWSDKASPCRWLLQYGNTGKQVTTTDGVRSEFHSKLEECDESRKGEVIPIGIRYALHSYQDIRELILQNGGPSFSEDRLCTAARRLHLTDNFTP